MARPDQAAKPSTAGFIPVAAFDIVVFGATGDLALRKLFPALFHRFLDGQISADTRILGVARQAMDAGAFRQMATEGYLKFAKGAESDRERFAAFMERVVYLQLDATQPNGEWPSLAKALDPDPAKPRVFYLAVAPGIYTAIAAQMQRAGLVTPATRIVLEKPIGKNLATAHEINAGIAAVFEENQVYRIDHYLGKETVQNLLVMRFANTMFEPLWSRANIDHVQITVAESLGVEGRGEYYDKSGALRDMVQNHLLQLLCLVAMEAPNSISADAIRTEKIKVLDALRPISASDVEEKTVRGQYRTGVFDGKVVPGYVEELPPGSASSTETFVAIKAEVDTWRWAGVPFYLRTGKRMAARRSEIVVQFRMPPHSVFGTVANQPNRLVIRLQPDEGVRMFLQMKDPGPGGLRIRQVPLNLSYADAFAPRYPDAYERLLMDVVRGNLSLFMRREEVEAAWRWVDGILDAWDQASLAPQSYQAGTNGPLQSSVLLASDGRAWWDPE